MKTFNSFLSNTKTLAYSTRNRVVRSKTTLIEWIRSYDEKIKIAILRFEVFIVVAWQSFLINSTRLLFRPTPPTNVSSGGEKMALFQKELFEKFETATFIMTHEHLALDKKCQILFSLQREIRELDFKAAEECGSFVDKENKVYKYIERFLRYAEGEEYSSSSDEETTTRTFELSNNNNNNSEISTEQIVEQYKATMRQRKKDFEEESKNIGKETEKTIQPLKDQGNNNTVGKKEEVISGSIPENPKPQKSGGWWDMISKFASENPEITIALALFALAGLGVAVYLGYNSYHNKNLSNNTDNTNTKNAVDPSPEVEVPINNVAVDPASITPNSQMITDHSWWSFFVENPYYLSGSLVTVSVIVALAFISWKRFRPEKAQLLEPKLKKKVFFFSR